LSLSLKLSFLRINDQTAAQFAFAAIMHKSVRGRC